ncbi:MAG: hypothetical protein KAU03_04180, partial [Candidatus Altiarchaeales archaeon]|nr:hypothetical protein [Candidatus Altiarchaeales archaeon]
IRGVCSSIGMDIIDVPGATGHVDSNIAGKAQAAINALKKHDFVFLHLKGTDVASHDGSFQKKKEMIERIDGEVIKSILEDVGDTTIALTGDHSTPVGIGQHSADPVPLVITGDVRVDSVKRFDERSCSSGGMNRICGRDLMGILLDLSDNIRLFGA